MWLEAGRFVPCWVGRAVERQAWLVSPFIIELASATNFILSDIERAPCGTENMHVPENSSAVLRAVFA